MQNSNKAVEKIVFVNILNSDAFALTKNLLYQIASFALSLRKIFAHLCGSYQTLHNEAP